MAHWAADPSVWQKVMASSSSWLNSCLFCSLLGICSRLSSIGQELLWQTQLLLPYCLLGSAGTQLVCSYLGVFQWEMPMSSITVIVSFPSQTEGNCSLGKNSPDTQRFFENKKILQCFVFYIFPLVRAWSKENKA